MRVLSLFSGIEAASVAWAPLGWEIVAVAEIEPFPCKVLAHHYPDVPNLGDVSKLTESDIRALGHIDLVVGGFPCQDLSVAGLRKGLKNEDGSATRSGLFYTAMRIARWAKPRWILLENVPGLYSSHKGNDFAAVVREMGGSSVSPTVPSAGWGTEGVALGEKALVEWTTLDAQWFGVAQRRRRCFALADFGDWTSRPPILLEQQSVRGDTPPSREKGQEVTEIAGTLSANGGGTTRPAGNANEVDFCITTNRMVAFGEYVDDDTAGALKQRDYKDATDLISYGIPGNWIGRKPENGGNGAGYSEDLSYTLTKTDVHAVAYPINTQLATREPDTSNTNREGVGLGNNGDPAFTLQASHHHAVAFKVRGGCEGGGKGYLGSEDAAFTPSTNQDQHIAIGWSEELTASVELAGTLQRGGQGGRHDGVMQSDMQVRRLTPRECERLQGFPDDYTNIPNASDGPRYKALGNSMAVPVMRWIGQRIKDAITAQELLTNPLP